MKIAYPSGVRSGWEDRNPTVIWKYFGLTGVSPHTLTQRWIYTVPANRRAFIYSLYIFYERATVATTVGRYGGHFGADDGVTTPAFIQTYTRDNTVGFIKDAALSPVGFMESSAHIQFYTTDTSTGGTVDFFGTLMALEFDK